MSFSNFINPRSYSSDFSDLFSSENFVIEKNLQGSFLDFQDEPLKIGERPLLIEENGYFLSIISKHFNFPPSKNRFIFFYHPSSAPPATTYFSGPSTKLSQRMSIHLVERSSSLYTIRRKREDWFFQQRKKGGFFEFFLSNLTNLIVSFSRGFFVSNFSHYSHLLKNQLLFFSKNSRHPLNLVQILYYSRLKNYSFLKKFYSNFYLKKRTLNKIKIKFNVFSKRSLILSKRVYLKKFLNNKFLNRKSVAIFFFLKKFKKFFQRKISLKLFNRKRIKLLKKKLLKRLIRGRKKFFSNNFYLPFYFYKLNGRYDKENLFFSLFNQNSDSKKNKLFELSSNNLRLLYFLNTVPLLKSLESREVFSGENLKPMPKINVFFFNKISANKKKTFLVKKFKPVMLFSKFFKKEQVLKTGSDLIAEKKLISAHNKLKKFFRTISEPFSDLEFSEEDWGVVSLKYRLSNIRKIPNKIQLQFKSERYRLAFNSLGFRKSTGLVNPLGFNVGRRFIMSVLGKKKFKFKKKIEFIAPIISKKFKSKKKKKKPKVSIFDKVKRDLTAIKPWRLKSHAQKIAFKYLKLSEPFSIPTNNRKERFFYKRQLYKHKAEFLKKDLPPGGWSDNLFWFSRSLNFKHKSSKYFTYPIFFKALGTNSIRNYGLNSCDVKKYLPLLKKNSLTFLEKQVNFIHWFTNFYRVPNAKFYLLPAKSLKTIFSRFRLNIFLNFLKFSKKKEFLDLKNLDFFSKKNTSSLSSFLLNNLFNFLLNSVPSTSFKVPYSLNNSTHERGLFLKTFKFLFLNFIKNSKFNFNKRFFREKEVLGDTLKLFSTKIILRYYFNWLNLPDLLLSKKINGHSASKNYLLFKFKKTPFLKKQFKFFTSFSNYCKKNIKNGQFYKNFKISNYLKRYKRSYLRRFLFKSAKLLRILKKRKIFRSVNSVFRFANRFFFGLKFRGLKKTMKRPKKVSLAVQKKMMRRFKFKKFRDFKFQKKLRLRSKKFLFYNSNRKNLFLKIRLKFLKINFKDDLKVFLYSKYGKKYKKSKMSKRDGDLEVFRKNKNSFTNFVKLFLFASTKTYKPKFIKHKLKNRRHRKTSRSLLKFFFVKNFNKLKNYYNFSKSLFRKKFTPLNLKIANKFLLKKKINFFSRKKSRLKFLNLKFLKIKRIYHNFSLKKLAAHQEFIRRVFTRRVGRRLMRILRRNKKFFFNYNFTDKLGNNSLNPDLKSNHLKTILRSTKKKFLLLKNTFLVKILIKKRNFFVDLTKEGSGKTLFSSSGGKGGFSGRTQLSKRSANLAGNRVALFLKKNKLGIRGGFSEDTLKFLPRRRAKSFEIRFNVKRLLKDNIFQKIDIKLKKRVVKQVVGFSRKLFRVTLQSKILKKAKKFLIRLRRKFLTKPSFLVWRNFFIAQYFQKTATRELIVSHRPSTYINVTRSRFLFRRFLYKKLRKIKKLKIQRFKFFKILGKVHRRYKQFGSKKFYYKFAHKIFLGYRYFFRSKFVFRVRFLRQIRQFKIRLSRRQFRRTCYVYLKKFQFKIKPKVKIRLKKKHKKLFKKVNRIKIFRKFSRIRHKSKRFIRSLRKKFFRKPFLRKLFKFLKKFRTERFYKKKIRRVKKKGVRLTRRRYRSVGKLLYTAKRRNIYMASGLKIGRVKFVYRGLKKSKAFFIARAVRFGVFLRRFFKLKPRHRRVVPFGFSRKPAVRRL